VSNICSAVPAEVDDTEESRCVICSRSFEAVLAELPTNPTAADEWTFIHGADMDVVAETCSDACTKVYDERARA
jgi:hypothetical protein